MTLKHVGHMGLLGLVLLGTATGLLAEDSASCVWLEKPQATDFNTVATWSVLAEGSAPANMPAGVNQPKERAFAEYAFELPPPGGRLTLWGRSFDPAWSSPARWRVDQEAWQPWQPGPCLDRMVANKNFPVEWHRWGEVSLAPGRHTLRVETLGKRAQGDYPYFVLDALLLGLGEYVPHGPETPQVAAAQRLQLLAAQAQPLADRAAFEKQAQAVADTALHSDLGAFSQFETLSQEIGRALEMQRLEQSSRQALNGKLDSAVLENGRTVCLELRWSAPFQGKLWIGFINDRSLYASVVREVGKEQRQTLRFALPDNLPAGRICVQCIPVDQPVTVPASGYLDVPAEAAAARPVARAWGVYRDRLERVHPWQVNDNNLLFWEGEPFIPFGGMINSLLSWATQAGEGTVNAQWENMLRQELHVLRRYGIRDVYFNGFFLHANPQALARMVAIAEECGMRYGLHPSSAPQRTDPGFVICREPLVVAANEKVVRLVVSLKREEALAEVRCLWCALDNAGKVVGSGRDRMTRLSADEALKLGGPGQPSAKREAKADDADTYALMIRLPQPAGAQGVSVHSAVERRLDREDPNGYLCTLDEQLARYREIYGGLPLGAGMRMWIDPLQNEMHHDPDSVGSSLLWQQRLAQWLLSRYGTIERLRESWGNRTAPFLPDFAAASRLVPLAEKGEGVYALEAESGACCLLSGRPGQALRDIREFSGQLAEEMISRCADALKRIADVPVVLKHNCWFSDWFVNPRTSGGQDGCGYEPYCYGDSLAYHNSLAAYAQVLQSARRQWALVTESSAAAFEGQKDYCGYLDRLQMIYDIDQLMMFGAKGFYHFGFSFAGNPQFDTTDLLRDIRQVEWLATQSKAYESAAGRLAAYRPEVYGWYPASLREGRLVGRMVRPYEMDGHYTGVTTQIRQAPDGRWILPALRPDAEWYGLLVAEPLLNGWQRDGLLKQAGALKCPVYVLQPKEPSGAATDWSAPFRRFPLDGFTSQGIGVLPANKRAMTLHRFQQEILGYRVFQTADVNGRTLADGWLLVWTCAERQAAELALPEAAQAFDLEGKARKPELRDGRRVLRLERPAYEKQTRDFPSYIMGGNYFYPDRGQPEVALLSGVTADELLALNPPARDRWLPDGVRPGQVRHWQEAEAFTETTFSQTQLEGFSRYSDGGAVGINSHAQPPDGQTYRISYTVTTPALASPVFWLRRMAQMSTNLTLVVQVDGKDLGALGEMRDLMHLNPWSAGLSRANLQVGWTRAACPALAAGQHRVEILALNRQTSSAGNRVDIALMGAQAAHDVGAAIESDRLSYLQLDAWMLTEAQ